MGPAESESNLCHTNTFADLAGYDFSHQYHSQTQIANVGSKSIDLRFYSIAMKELKKTAYHNVQATVIASRDRLCIHPKLKGKSNTDKILMCKNMMHKSEDGTCASECQFYQNIGNGPQLDNITDIEDLGSYGKKHECCPYYMAKKASVESDIIFIPYGYLIDPTIRESNDINLKDSIVILDEGHNVNRVCEDSASASIRNTEISSAIRYLNSVISYVLKICFARLSIN